MNKFRISEIEQSVFNGHDVYEVKLYDSDNTEYVLQAPTHEIISDIRNSLISEINEQDKKVIDYAGKYNCC